MVISYWAMQNKINEHLRHATNLDDETISEPKQKWGKNRRRRWHRVKKAKKSYHSINEHTCMLRSYSLLPTQKLI